jgi:four helix bundle protein
MKSNNIILDKTFDFAVKIIRLNQYLIKQQKEFVLSAQIIKSGTSIGANAEEAIGGDSRKDFINKFGISYKEARETKYWLRLLEATDYIDKEMATSYLNDVEEILKIIGSIIKSSNENDMN